MTSASHSSAHADPSSLLTGWAALWDAPQLAAFAQVRFSRRLRAAAGRCRPERGEIVLNERLLAEHPEEFAPTLCHEAAHVAVWLRWGRRADPHGPEWRGLMAAAGFAAEPRCGIAAPAPAAHGTKRYLHRCPECGYAHRDRSPKIRWMCPVCAQQARRVPLEVVAVVEPPTAL